MLEAAELFNGRLPEAFAGYAREATNYPVEYPTACSPQAWATGAPLLLIRAMLGLEAKDGDLIVDPAVPKRSAGSSCSICRASGDDATHSAEREVTDRAKFCERGRRRLIETSAR